LRVAWFDCFSGISGDMTLGALLACGVETDFLRAELTKLNLTGWRLDVEPTSQNGIGATDVTVTLTEPQGHGRHLHHIEEILAASDISEAIQAKALTVFQQLAEAEAKIHQTTVERIHFHEVGAVDAIVDIVGSCIILEKLGVEEIVCSPLPMGRGFIECAHGTIPLPAPAVLELVQGVPVYSVDIEGELVTPTGAALMKTLAARFGPMPTMTVRTSGYGSGKKRFGNRPNLLRVIIGDTVEDVFSGAPEIAVLETNLDDFSPQFYEPLTEKLLAAGAADVYLASIQMKKGRPATLLTILASPDKAESMAEILFTETTTLGLRYGTMRRLCLDREWVSVETEYGPIRVKIGRWRGVEKTASPEFEDVKAASLKFNAPTKTVHQAALLAYSGLMRDA
jgi:uncharacterized protein (TIGR00299 family) protein